MILTFFNQKGGVGKTTCAVNTAAALSQEGKDALVVDMDYQGDASRSLGYEIFQAPKEQVTSYDILDPLTSNIPEEAIIEVGERLYLIPASTKLAGVNQEYFSNNEMDLRSKHLLLSSKLKRLEGFDYIIVDSRPSANDLTALNTVAAADIVVIVFGSGYLDFRSINWLNRIFKGLMEGRVIPKNIPVYALVNLYDRRQTIDRTILKRVQEAFGDKAFKTVIRKNTDLTWASSAGIDIIRNAPKSRGAKDFNKLAKELIKIGTPGKKGTS